MILPSSRDSYPPVLTVTLNPVVDMTFTVPHFSAGKTFLAEGTDAYAGGKGVNASRALLRLNVSSTATGIIGRRGRSGYLGILDNEGIRHDFMYTEGSVRTNVTIVTIGKRETHIRDRGPHLAAEVFTDFLTHFKKILADAKSGLKGTGKDEHTSKPVVILSGSIPKGIHAKCYRALLQETHKMGCLSVLDASGEPLRQGLEEKPFFIKPNRYEAMEALGFLPESEHHYRKAIDAFHGKGIELVMISRGEEGLYLSDGRTVVSASVHVERTINTVGSGDAALAGAVFGTISDFSIEQTARLSCALGAANTILAGACIFEIDRLRSLYKEVRVKTL